jgi:hypothetical protein
MINTAARTLAAAMVLAAGAASAESVSFGLSNDSYRFGLTGPLSRVFSGVDGKYDLGFIQRNDNGEHSYAGHVGLLASGDAGLRDVKLNAGVGLRAVLAGGHGEHGGAVAPGIELDLRVPGYERVGILAHGYYAPSVVSFGDLDNYRDVGGGLSYQINRSAVVSVGYRNVRFGVDGGGDITIDNGFFIGLGLIF